MSRRPACYTTPTLLYNQQCSFVSHSSTSSILLFLHHTLYPSQYIHLTPSSLFLYTHTPPSTTNSTTPFHDVCTSPCSGGVMYMTQSEAFHPLSLHSSIHLSALPFYPHPSSSSAHFHFPSIDYHTPSPPPPPFPPPPSPLLLHSFHLHLPSSSLPSTSIPLLYITSTSIYIHTLLFTLHLHHSSTPPPISSPLPYPYSPSTSTSVYTHPYSTSRLYRYTPIHPLHPPPSIHTPFIYTSTSTSTTHLYTITPASISTSHSTARPREKEECTAMGELFEMRVGILHLREVLLEGITVHI